MRLNAGFEFVRSGRSRVGAARLLAAGLFSIFVAVPAIAGPGSGTAAVSPASPVVAGSSGTWAITYVAGEDFDTLLGGAITIDIPVGWTAPQNTGSTAAGYGRPSAPSHVTPVLISGPASQAPPGARPATRFT